MKLLLLSAFYYLIALVCLGEVRTWTNAAGDASFLGHLVEIQGERVLIERDADRHVFTLEIGSLSDSDQTWIEEQRWNAVEESGAVVADPPPAQLDWPRHLRVGPNYAIEVVSEDRAANHFVYRSNHFEFVSDVPLSRRVIREFGQIFEATYLAVEAMPFRWEPRPPTGDHFQVRLFGNRSGYYAAGGIPNSGGVYMSHQRTILVPLTSVGMRRTSSEYTFDPNSDFRILIHEVTHQVHHHWLRRLPVWLTEGLAVYIDSVPYHRGEFRFDRRDLAASFSRRSRKETFVPLERMFQISNREWNDTLARDPEYARLHYATALLMADFFFHHDDGGKRLYRYLRAIDSGQTEQEARKLLLGERTMDELSRDFTRALERQRLRLTPAE